MKSILDPSFRYVPSFSTDLQKTFARVRRDRRAAASSLALATAGASLKVSSIVGKTAARQRSDYDPISAANGQNMRNGLIVPWLPLASVAAANLGGDHGK